MTGSRRLLGLCLALSLLLPATVSRALMPGFDPTGSGERYPQRAQGRITAQPTIRAHRLNGIRVRLDGHLDDAAWHDAEAGGGFVQFEPDRGTTPTEDTVFKIVYDDEAIYFGVACYENDTSKTSSSLARRDRITDSDLVSVYVDPYHDQTTGYNFRVNPDGVKMDQYVFNDGEMDVDWDTVWDAEVSRDERGWYVEMRIPFSSIRYREAEEMTWGLQIYRWMHGRGEDTGWAVWERDVRGFVSRFGDLTGLQGIRPPRQLELLPYAVQSAADHALSGPEDDIDNFQNYGLDIKYGVSSDLTLNATFQPDFGQVEADPSILNLSPFETFFDEKRPFFIEGSRFFQHPDFNLFYSRRIGFEDDEGNSRIRFAGKLTGKTAGDISVAALFATTDVADRGESYNVFKSGSDPSRYFVGRFGKEFKEGNHRVNLMQTAVVRPGAGRGEAYSTGLDFDLNFHDREYNIQGSVVGSVLDDDWSGFGLEETGGNLDIRRVGGNLRGGWFGRWEGDQLDINDLGFLSAPNEINTGFWGQHRYNSDGNDDAPFNQGTTNINFWNSWIYGAGSGSDAQSGATIWNFDARHHQATGGDVNAWWQLRSYRSLWYGLVYEAEGSSPFNTRGGPLMTVPVSYGGWWGTESDWRKKFAFNVEGDLFWDVEGGRQWELEAGFRWTQSNSVNHRVSIEYNAAHHDAQHMSPVDDALASPDNDSNFDNPGGGIGGISYVFGELDNRTLDLTLRTNVLFSRDQSLELYVQPFITVGNYRNPRELARPDSYDLQPFTTAGFEASDSDFNFASVNLNLVYRWEYRSGSTFFLVWTHSRSRWEERFTDRDAFDGDFRAGNLFTNEPENVFLTKLSYWFSI